MCICTYVATCRWRSTRALCIFCALWGFCMVFAVTFVLFCFLIGAGVLLHGWLAAFMTSMLSATVSFTSISYAWPLFLMLLFLFPVDVDIDENSGYSVHLPTNGALVRCVRHVHNGAFVFVYIWLWCFQKYTHIHICIDACMPAFTLSPIYICILYVFVFVEVIIVIKYDCAICRSTL